MKRKILSVLLSVMVVFGIMGCDFEPTPENFFGRWKSKESAFDNIIQIAEDGEWAKGDFIKGWEVGKWVHNEDGTMTLIREAGENYIAEYHSKRIYDKDSEGNRLDTYTTETYLLINGVKYYKD